MYLRLCGGMSRDFVALAGTIKLNSKKKTDVPTLGIFIEHSLTWDHHMATMAQWTRSTVHALRDLTCGPGLDAANWRKILSFTLILHPHLRNPSLRFTEER